MSTLAVLAPPDDRVRATVLPPDDSASVQEVEDFLAAHTHSAALEADGMRVELPDAMFQVLTTVTRAMLEGQAVTVVPVATRLTTGQAADMLGVSRQTLVRLLDEGKLPYEQPRQHRVLRLNDVLAYRERRHTENRLILDELTRQAVQDGLYDDKYEDYEEALRLARKGEL